MAAPACSLVARIGWTHNLDVERIRSLVSQLEEGVVDTFSKSLASSSTIKGSAKGNLLGVVSGDAGVEQLWARDSHESRSLHDYIFTRLEDLLLREKLVKDVDDLGVSPSVNDLRMSLLSTDSHHM